MMTNGPPSRAETIINSLINTYTNFNAEDESLSVTHTQSDQGSLWQVLLSVWQHSDLKPYLMKRHRKPLHHSVVWNQMCPSLTHTVNGLQSDMHFQHTWMAASLWSHLRRREGTWLGVFQLWLFSLCFCLSVHRGINSRDTSSRRHMKGSLHTHYAHPRAHMCITEVSHTRLAACALHKWLLKQRFTHKCTFLSWLFNTISI